MQHFTEKGLNMKQLKELMGEINEMPLPECLDKIIIDQDCGDIRDCVGGAEEISGIMCCEELSKLLESRNIKLVVDNWVAEGVVYLCNEEKLRQKSPTLDFRMKDQ